MEIKAGIDTYSLPPLSHIESLVYFLGGDPRTHPDSLPVVPIQVSPGEMLALRRQAAARRNGLHFTVPRVAMLPTDPDGLSLVFYPSPAQDTVLRVRYYPPLMEI